MRERPGPPRPGRPERVGQVDVRARGAAADHAPAVHQRGRDAAQHWPGHEQEHAYEAAEAAATARDDALAHRASFVTETVFSHPSKVELVERASALGYLVQLHVMLVPEELAAARVAYRVAEGGHAVPEHEIRERHRRLWELVAQARPVAHRAYFYDNSRANGFARVAHFELGLLVGTPAWPAWTPAAPLAPSGEASGERRTI